LLQDAVTGPLRAGVIHGLVVSMVIDMAWPLG